MPVPILVKIDKKYDRGSARRRTHSHTMTDANRFYNLSHAICHSYGTDNKKYLTKFYMAVMAPSC